MGLPKDILEEATEILRKSQVLQATAVWQSEQIHKFVVQHTEEEFEALPWDEKERVQKVGEELIGRLQVSIKELRVLSDEYERLRVRLEEEYGDTRLPSIKEEIERELGEEEEDDEGEEWRKE